MGLKMVCILSITMVFGGFFKACEPKNDWNDFKGGHHIVLEVQSIDALSEGSQMIQRAKEIITQRVDHLGIEKKLIKIEEEKRIILQLPPVDDPKKIINVITKSAILEFKLVDERHSIEEAEKGNIPTGSEILYSAGNHPHSTTDQNKPYLLIQKPLITGNYIKDAKVTVSNYTARLQISITFNNRGAKILERITSENISKRLAIVLDDRVYAAPVIQDKIAGGNAMISGQFTDEEARDLAIVLRSGALPAPCKVIAYQKLTKDKWIGDED